MFRQLGLPAWVALYLVAIPLALIVGVSVADPLAPTSLIALAMIIGLGLAPIVLRFYHESLIISWNSALVVFFLPGRPTLAMGLTVLVLLIAFVKRAMIRQPVTLPARMVTIPLLVLGMVILVTAALTGGLVGRVFGSEMWGLRRYAGVILGVAGYIALISHAIPLHRAALMAGLFVLSAVTAALSDLAYAMDWYFLFLIFATDVAFLQAVSEQVGTFVRLTGVCWASWAAFNFLLLRYGLQGLFNLTRPWRLVLALGALAGTLAGGYRSYIVLAALMFLLLFWLEGLHRTHFALFAVGFLLLATVAILPNVRSLPLAIQRSLSILPLDVDPVASRDAQGTLDWRIEMWKVVLPEVPQHLLLGKGFAYSGTDYYLTQEAYRRGLLRMSYEDTLISGNYHNGILTLIIPFGIWGFLAFCWFAIASIIALVRNYRFGLPQMLLINRFFLALFLTRLIFYVTVYGQFDLDLPMLTGIVGMSIALNGGILTAPAKVPVTARTESGELLPAGEGTFSPSPHPA
jgi:hypothetical protein